LRQCGNSCGSWRGARYVPLSGLPQRYASHEMLEERCNNNPPTHRCQRSESHSDVTKINMRQRAPNRLQ